MYRKAMLAMAFVAGAAAPAQADEQVIRRVIGGKLSGGTIVSVQKLSRGELYEVRAEGERGTELLYTDAAAQIVVLGEVFDAATGANLTEARLRELSATVWNSLPFEWALTAKRGSGRRQIAIFSDPNCPYCQRFERDLAHVGDITVHIFMYPLKRESVRQTKAVWCSPDRLRAWNDLMLKRTVPAAEPDCENPIDALLALGRRLGANATPTWFLPDGKRYVGAMRMEDVIPLLNAASPADASPEASAKPVRAP